jgi:hypothetical protein
MTQHHENEQFIPKVPAKLSRDKRTFEIFCPYCGEIHTHGAGEDGNLYGHRAAHCYAHDIGGYELVRATRFFK